MHAHRKETATGAATGTGMATATATTAIATDNTIPFALYQSACKSCPQGSTGCSVALLCGGCYSSSFAAEIARKKYDHEIESNSTTKLAASAAAAVAALCCVAFSGEQANENEMTNEANFKRRPR